MGMLDTLETLGKFAPRGWSLRGNHSPLRPKAKNYLSVKSCWGSLHQQLPGNQLIPELSASPSPLFLIQRTQLALLSWEAYI